MKIYYRKLMERERNLMDEINRRKIAFFGRSLRHLKLVFEGKVLGTKSRGRPRMKIWNMHNK